MILLEDFLDVGTLHQLESVEVVLLHLGYFFVEENPQKLQDLLDVDEHPPLHHLAYFVELVHHRRQVVVQVLHVDDVDLLDFIRQLLDHLQPELLVNHSAQTQQQILHVLLVHQLLLLNEGFDQVFEQQVLLRNYLFGVEVQMDGFGHLLLDRLLKQGEELLVDQVEGGVEVVVQVLVDVEVFGEVLFQHFASELLDVVVDLDHLLKGEGVVEQESQLVEHLLVDDLDSIVAILLGVPQLFLQFEVIIEVNDEIVDHLTVRLEELQQPDFLRNEAFLQQSAHVYGLLFQLKPKLNQLVVFLRRPHHHFVEQHMLSRQVFGLQLLVQVLDCFLDVGVNGLFLDLVEHQ